MTKTYALVWVLSRLERHEGGSVVGVFTSIRAAESAALDQIEQALARKHPTWGTDALWRHVTGLEWRDAEAQEDVIRARESGEVGIDRWRIEEWKVWS